MWLLIVLFVMFGYKKHWIFIFSLLLMPLLMINSIIFIQNTHFMMILNKCYLKFDLSLLKRLVRNAQGKRLIVGDCVLTKKVSWYFNRLILCAMSVS